MKLRALRKRQSRVTRPFRHIRSFGRREAARMMTGGVGTVECFRLIIGVDPARGEDSGCTVVIRGDEIIEVVPRALTRHECDEMAQRLLTR